MKRKKNSSSKIFDTSDFLLRRDITFLSKCPLKNCSASLSSLLALLLGVLSDVNHWVVASKTFRVGDISTNKKKGPMFIERLVSYSCYSDKNAVHSGGRQAGQK
jgi:hypothetical protein